MTMMATSVPRARGLGAGVAGLQALGDVAVPRAGRGEGHATWLGVRPRRWAGASVGVVQPELAVPDARDGVPRPGRVPGSDSIPVHEDRLGAHGVLQGPVIPLEDLLRPVKLQRMALEALLRERLGSRAQPVLVAAAVVVADAPSHLHPRARRPTGPLRHRRGGQLGAHHALSCQGRVVEDGVAAELLEAVFAAGLTAGIHDRSEARSAPGVVSV
mmetsp:Transcript_62465/g.140558  ORF Transcript_62465/g.140558 Transcript_62465/m.140558 type:complete len:215 (+) Transcript_62465:308-952(+)